MPIPEYRIERAEDETDSSFTGSTSTPTAGRTGECDDDDDAEDEEEENGDQSDSESSSSAGTPRTHLGRAQRLPRGGPSASLGDISITVDRSRALGAGGSLRQRHPAPARPMISSQSMGQIARGRAAGASGGAAAGAAASATASPVVSPPTGTASSARVRTLPRGGTQQITDGLSKEEAMALEIESLKMMLANAQIGCGNSSGNTGMEEEDLTQRPVLNARVSMLQGLRPSTVALPESVGAVCSVQVVGSTLWVGGSAGTVLAYSLPHLQLVASARVHRSRVAAVVRVGSSRVCCSSDEGAVYVFSPRDPARARRHAVHDAAHSAVRALLYLDGARPRLWSCAPARGSTQIAVMNRRCEVRFKLTVMQSLAAAAVSPTLETCWLGCAAGSVLVCDAAHGDLRREVLLPSTSSSFTTKQQPPSVRALLSVGDLVWCAAGPCIHVHDPFSFACEKTLTLSPPADIESLALFESVVLAGTAAGTVECFDSISMAHILSLPLAGPSSPGPVSALAAVPGSLLTGRTGVPALFAAPASSSTLHLWSTPSVPM